MTHIVEIDLEGRKISLETGKIAKQAHGSVVVRLGDTVVLVTACSNEQPKPGAAFFPLTVDYREYTYAAGRFPGGFIKREGRPSERETLTCRMIDRPLRPLFPEGYSCETQIIGMVLSADPDVEPAPLALLGAAAALAISDIPFEHILAAVTVASVDGRLIANPSHADLRESKLNIVVAATDDGIVMVEAGATRSLRGRSSRAIEFGHAELPQDHGGNSRTGRQSRQAETRAHARRPSTRRLYDKIAAEYRADLIDALDTEKYPKLESHHRATELRAKALESIPDEQKAEAADLFERLRERIFRDEMLDGRRRPDGRAFDKIRQIDVEAGVLPRTHGSGLFTRGETQALVTVTLGTKDDEQRLELLESRAKPPNASCCITTSRRSAWARLGSCAARAAVRSDTAPWPSAPWRP